MRRAALGYSGFALLLACQNAAEPRPAGQQDANKNVDQAAPTAAPAAVNPEAPETSADVSVELERATAKLAPARAELARTATAVVEQIRQLESERDVTCWTSFRQLDNFIASKSYSSFATLTKIIAAKALLQSVWISASQASQEATLSDKDIAAVLELQAEVPADKKQQLEQLALDLGAQQFKDYRTTSEHWRLVLAIAQDELMYSQPRVKPLTAEGAQALALLGTRLSLALLTESGQVALEARSPMIEVDHVKRAFENLRQRFKLADVPQAPGERDVAGVEPVLRVLTRDLVEAKLTALRTFNHAGEDLVAELNKISKIPLDRGAAAALRAKLDHFAEFLARGYEPMRADNYLADGNFAPGDLVGRAYIDPAYVENATVQLFPYVMMPNGDVRLHFEPRPGTLIPSPAPGQDVLLLDHQMNAVRDTALHWAVLQDVWREHPFAMDPFAGEYLSELVSIVGTYWLRRAQTIARNHDRETINEELIRSVDDNRFVMVLPAEVGPQVPWSDKQQRAKERVLAGYGTGRFRDVTQAVGLPTQITFAHVAATDPGSGSFDIQRVMGAGIAVGDVDGDGDSDLFFAGEGLGRLYLNESATARGTEQGPMFVDGTEAWAVPAGLEDSHHALFVDHDGDGDLDLLVIRGHKRSLLLRSEDGKFTDVATAVGFVTGPGAHVASAFDYDGDGDLDLHVGYYGSAACNRGECAGRNLPSVDGRNGTANQLFRNDGDHYTEVARAAGCADEGWTLASSTADIDGDGDLDLFLANDFGENPVFRNNGDGTFANIAAELGADDRGSGMNISFSDVNDDGVFDFFVSNIDMFSKTIKVVFPQDESVVNLTDGILRSFQYLSGDKFYVSHIDGKGQRSFAPQEGTWFEPGDRGWGWAGVFFDVDNDQDEDLYLANGWIPGSPAADQANQMLVRDGHMFFVAPPELPETFAGNSRSVIAFDMEGDGDLDLVVGNFAAAPRVLENIGAGGNKSLRLRLRGAGLNTRAIGALVEVRVGRRVQRRQVTAGIGYLGQDDEVMVVGMGRAATAEVVVTWPDGTKVVRRGLAAGQLHTVVQDTKK